MTRLVDAHQHSRIDFVDGLSWSRLLADYDISRGRLLLLVWVTLGGGPFLLARRRPRRLRRRGA
jgi:hypothetical protein